MEARLHERKMNRAQNEKSLETLKSKGMQVTVPSPEEVVRMREKVKPVVGKDTNEVGEAQVKELYAEIDKVRGQN
jgi:TRAP-type C4-dicarboxylate transport system substrate-binding protein